MFQSRLQQTHAVLFLSKQQRLTHSHLTSIWYDTISIYQELSVKWVWIVWRALWQCMLKMLTMRMNEDARSYSVSTWTLVRKGERSVSGRFGQPANAVEINSWDVKLNWGQSLSIWGLSVFGFLSSSQMLKCGSCPAALSDRVQSRTGGWFGTTAYIEGGLCQKPIYLQ